MKIETNEKVYFAENKHIIDIAKIFKVQDKLNKNIDMLHKHDYKKNIYFTKIKRVFQFKILGLGASKQEIIGNSYLYIISLIEMIEKKYFLFEF